VRAVWRLTGVFAGLAGVVGSLDALLAILSGRLRVPVVVIVLLFLVAVAGAYLLAASLVGEDESSELSSVWTDL